MWDEWQDDEPHPIPTDYQRGVVDGRRFAEGQLAEHVKMEAALVKRIAALEAEVSRLRNPDAGNVGGCRCTVKPCRCEPAAQK